MKTVTIPQFVFSHCSNNYHRFQEPLWSRKIDQGDPYSNFPSLVHDIYPANNCLLLNLVTSYCLDSTLRVMTPVTLKIRSRTFIFGVLLANQEMYTCCKNGSLPQVVLVTYLKMDFQDIRQMPSISMSPQMAPSATAEDKNNTKPFAATS